MARVQAASQPPVRYLRLKLFGLLGLCLLPGIGTLRLAMGEGAWLVLAGYPLASLVSLLLYWHDKRQARTQARRVPERLLHASELCGGWPGALLAQQVFRHKTRKLSYQLPFWAIVLLHQGIWAGYLTLGSDAVRHALAPLAG
ncbi:DUF1294 domain-containing protein [Pseudomonas fulva]|nr:DUF1294 domain-containing protein [Pseudomonas fulva]MBF8778281.1 DUF1294 domain-containing protein [Pseudomonas fulva]